MRTVTLKGAETVLKALESAVTEDKVVHLSADHSIGLPLLKALNVMRRQLLSTVEVLKVVTSFAKPTPGNVEAYYIALKVSLNSDVKWCSFPFEFLLSDSASQHISASKFEEFWEVMSPDAKFPMSCAVVLQSMGMETDQIIAVQEKIISSCVNGVLNGGTEKVEVIKKLLQAGIGESDQPRFPSVHNKEFMVHLQDLYNLCFYEDVSRESVEASLKNIKSNKSHTFHLACDTFAAGMEVAFKASSFSKPARKTRP